MIWPLVVYFIFLVIYVIGSAILFYHLNEFGYVGDACRPMTVAYTVASLVIVILTFVALMIAGGVHA